VDERPEALARLRGTVGIWTTTTESSPAERAGEVAAELEALGYPALWIPEAWGRESLTNAALQLGATTRLVVATGIASIYARDAVASANGARTLSAAYPGRFVLGLGVSHRPLVERLRHQEYLSPVAAMRAYLEAMDAAPMLAPESGERVARVLAALGPRMLALSAALADGAHTYLVTPEHTARARAAVSSKFVAVEQAVVLGGDREEFLARAHAYLEIYAGLENYRASWRRLGFADEDFVRGGSERLCDALVVHGDAARIAEGVAAHRDAGADHVCLQVLGPDLFAPPREGWRALAPAPA
jgi:probable F420-dependent oxidoreductase